MIYLIPILNLLLAVNVYASNKTYKLNCEFSVDNKIVSKPQFIVEEGKLGKIVTDNETSKSTIEVVAKPGEMDGQKGILMNFQVNYMSKDGMRKIESKPSVLAKSGEEAIIEIGDKNRKITMKVTAREETI